MSISILRRLEPPGNRRVRCLCPWYQPGEPHERGSYPQGGKKTAVLLDAARLLGKLHFSLWPRCHNSFPPKWCTISTSRSVRLPFSTACSCAVIPRTSCGETSKCLQWSLPNGTARQKATRSAFNSLPISRAASVRILDLLTC